MRRWLTRRRAGPGRTCCSRSRHLVLSVAGRPASSAKRARCTERVRHEPAIPATLPDDVLRHVARGSRAAEFTSSGRHAAAERLLRDVAGALVRRQALAPAAQALVSLGRLLLERGRAVGRRARVRRGRRSRPVGQGPGAVAERAHLAGSGPHRRGPADGGRIAVSGVAADRRARRRRARTRRGHAGPRFCSGRDGSTTPHSGISSCAGDDLETTAYVSATAIRVSLAIGDVFAAGQRARELLERWPRLNAARTWEHQARTDARARVVRPHPRAHGDWRSRVGRGAHATSASGDAVRANAIATGSPASVAVRRLSTGGARGARPIASSRICVACSRQRRRFSVTRSVGVSRASSTIPPFDHDVRSSEISRRRW